MERLQHPDAETERLIHWYQHELGWKGEQRDAHQVLTCPTCGHREYLYLMDRPQVPAAVLRDRFEEHRCEKGEESA